MGERVAHRLSVPFGGGLGQVGRRRGGVGPLARGGGRRTGQLVRRGVDERLQGGPAGQPRPHEAFVGGVLEQPTHEVRHARDELADGRVDTEAEPRRTHRLVDRLRHAVEHLELVAVVGDAPGARRDDRVRDRSQVVAAERGADLAVVIVQQARALLEARVGFGLVLEDRDRPVLRLRVHGLGVPVGTLHESDRERHGARAGEFDDRLEIAARFFQIRLQRDAGVQRRELVLGEQSAEQFQGDVFHLGVFHVEIDERAIVPGAPQDRTEPRRRLVDSGRTGER